MQNVTIITAAASEPVTLSDAKSFMRIDGSDENDLITELIKVAREMAEEYTRRKFINTVLQLTLDAFPLQGDEYWWNGVRQGSISEMHRQADSITLPFVPVSAVSSVTTYSTSNVSSVFSSDNYTLDEANGRVVLNDGAVWPTALRNKAAIAVNYTAGYGANASDVPSSVRQAIKMIVVELYENRTCASIPMSAQKLLMPYRILEERNNGARG